MNADIKVISLDFVNAFLVKAGDGYVLIDTGLPNQGGPAGEGTARCRMFPGTLKLILITHGDWDHTGNAYGLREKYKARIAMHRGDVNQVGKRHIFKTQGPAIVVQGIFYHQDVKKKTAEGQNEFPQI